MTMADDPLHRPRAPATLRAAALLAGPVLALALAPGCGDDGRRLRPPAPGATAPAPPISTTPPTVTVSGVAATIALTSPSFAEGEAIPSRYSCSGGNVSPPLSWAGVPEGTVELAIVVIDLDAAGFVHWVLGGLGPGLTSLLEGERPEGTVEARNDSSEFGWFGPCLPGGGGPHRYAFTLYALGASAGLAPGVGAADAIPAIEAAAIARGTLVGTFTSG